MARADSASIVAMEVLMEQHQVAPMRIEVIESVGTVNSADALLVAQKDTREPAGDLGRDLPQRHIVT
jgi:hypothetical protein